eukprot:TRINITY_DN5361_c0_g1_i2.p1 TRINITY_DN5361_c0_g1~~TRINITY_DN5361_c0_g1_i2.p1  ORF type:complete len:240 (+),score=2.22 TRINITY_DN5361_c0_g1_i2:254-973(+)
MMKMKHNTQCLGNRQLNAPNCLKRYTRTAKKKKEVCLKLEIPDKFSVLLTYIIYGKMADELSISEVFPSYINDTIYLGISELEEHFLSMMEKVCKTKQSDWIDFSISPPCRDFIDRFLRAKYESVAQYQYDLIHLLLKWLSKVKLDYTSIKSFVGFPFDVSKLSLQQIQDLQNRFPKEFECLVSVSSVLTTLLSKVLCRNCGKLVNKASIGTETCYRFKKGYSTLTAVYTQNGVHSASV